MNACACGCGAQVRGRFKQGHGANRRRGPYANGRFVDTEGYVRVFVGRDHPMALSTGYVMEHRLVMSQELGRVLERHEVVHHLNHDRADNRPENLSLFGSPTDHNRHHAEIRRRVSA